MSVRALPPASFPRTRDDGSARPSPASGAVIISEYAGMTARTASAGTAPAISRQERGR